jgi:threonine/homoserine/homoserine lactone efflux protein
MKKKAKESQPITFLNTFFFQFVNPKSIIAGLTAISLFIDTQNNYLKDSIIFVIVMFFIAVGSQATWCLTGTYLRKFATSEKFMSNFNYSMSFLLIVCVIMFYV